MRIGELARRTGASVRSLRYYETQDLISSRRTTGGHREFDEDAVDRVTLLRHLFAAGLTSRSAVEILPCVYSGTVTARMLDGLVAERERIGDQLRDLATTAARLDEVIEQARDRLSPPSSDVTEESLSASG